MSEIKEVPDKGLISSDIELLKAMINAYSKEDFGTMILTLEQWIKNSNLSESERQEHHAFLNLLKLNKSHQGVENYFFLFYTRKYFSMIMQMMSVFDKKMENQRNALEGIESNIIKEVESLQSSLAQEAGKVIEQAKYLTESEKSFINGLLEARRMLSPDSVNAKLDTAIMQENLKGVAKEEKMEELEVKINNVESTVDSINTKIDKLLSNPNGNNVKGNTNKSDISREEFEHLQKSIDNLNKKLNEKQKPVIQKPKGFIEKLKYLFS